MGNIDGLRLSVNKNSVLCLFPELDQSGNVVGLSARSYPLSRFSDDHVDTPHSEIEPIEYLGIVLDHGQQRVGHNGMWADLSGSRCLWILTCELCRSGATFRDGEWIAERIARQDAEFVPLVQTIREHIRRLRPLLAPLGLTVANRRYTGYRLEEI